jgi:dTDP-4-amino-4,6-dideoxygalactose transaminase
VSQIPLVDLVAQHRAVADEVVPAMIAVMEQAAFIQGKEVTAFEEEFASFSGVQHCVGVANGTDAIELALRAAGVGPGDEVVVPANTFVATAEAALRIGARIVCVDVDDEHLLIDPSRIEAAITDRTRAILPVHLFGQIAPMAAVLEIADRAGVVLIEDAAQAQGATQSGLGIGSWGLSAATSFYPGKNLGAYGDAGAVISRSAEHADAVRALANHGSTQKYHHPVLGFNSRLDTLQAVVLRAKLSRLAQWNQQRRDAAEYYRELLADDDRFRLPTQAADNEHVWHLYVIRVSDRDSVLSRLNSAGIGAGIHYPIPIHLQGVLADHGYRRGDFPITETSADQILSLPIFPGITREQQQRVAEVLKAG